MGKKNKSKAITKSVFSAKEWQRWSDSDSQAAKRDKARGVASFALAVVISGGVGAVCMEAAQSGVSTKEIVVSAIAGVITAAGAIASGVEDMGEAAFHEARSEKYASYAETAQNS